MILSAGGWSSGQRISTFSAHSRSLYSHGDEFGEDDEGRDSASPDEEIAIDETSRTTTVLLSSCCFGG